MLQTARFSKRESFRGHSSFVLNLCYVRPEELFFGVNLMSPIFISLITPRQKRMWANSNKEGTSELQHQCTEEHVLSVSQLSLTLCDPVDCSPPSSPVCGMLQARTLEWVAIPFSRRSSQTKDRTWVFSFACRFFSLSHQEGPSNKVNC